MTEIRKAIISVAIFSIVVINLFSIYFSFSTDLGVDITDRATLNRTSGLQDLVNAGKTDADGFIEEDVGGFSILRGGITYIKTMFGITNLITGLFGDLAEFFQLPDYIVNNMNLIITTIFLSAIVGYIWSKKAT